MSIAKATVLEKPPYAFLPHAGWNFFLFFVFQFLELIIDKLR
jgi:hypothetical protein